MQCASNLRQIFIGMAAYAVDNQQRYPASSWPGNWPMGSWGVNNPSGGGVDPWVPSGPALLYRDEYISSPEFYYCPLAEAETFSFSVQEPTWNIDLWNTANLGSYPVGGYAYWATFRRGPLQTSWNVFGDVLPADRQMLAWGPDNQTDLLVLADIVAEDPSGLWDKSNHHASDRSPGGNETSNDGSTAWVGFDSMKLRVIELGGLDLYFQADDPQG